jgi:large subunit ribosomal protein L35
VNSLPKQKTSRAAAKRFKLTKTGKIKRASAFRNHMFSNKTTKQTRNLRRGGYVDKADAKVIKKLIPYM